MKGILTTEISAAFLAALTTLKTKNTAGYFKQLEILYHLHAKDDRYKEISLAHFLDQLTQTYKKEISALSDDAIAFYQAMNASLRGFPIIGATLTGILLHEERSEQSRAYLARYVFIAAGIDPEHAILPENPAFLGTQHNIHKILTAGEISHLLLPSLLHKETLSQEKQPDDREIIALAMTAFANVPSCEFHLRKIHELIEEYWKNCIDALNTNDIHAFYSALANLAKASVHQIVASNKSPSGDKIKEVFQALHEKMNISTQNFSSPLTEKGLEVYKTLFKEHCRSFKEISMAQASDNVEDQINRQKKASSNYFFFLLLPAPDNFLEDMPDSSAVQSAINIEFDSREFEQQYKQQIAAQERRIQSAKYSCLLVLKKQIENEEWRLEGKTLAGFLFPLLSLCSPSFGHKTPNGVRKLQKLLANQPVNGNSEQEYSAVKALLFTKAKKKFCRNERTNEFYSAWRKNLSRAENGVALSLGG